MLDHVYEILRDKNLKLTQRRKEILQVLYDNRGSHLDIDSIYTLASADERKKVGMATVYRTLELFEKIGLVSRIAMEKSAAKYELNIYNQLSHHHLICLKCGAVQEIDDIITRDFKARIEEETDFKVADKPMKIYGYCSKCETGVDCCTGGECGC